MKDDLSKDRQVKRNIKYESKTEKDKQKENNEQKETNYNYESKTDRQTDNLS